MMSSSTYPDSKVESQRDGSKVDGGEGQSRRGDKVLGVCDGSQKYRPRRQEEHRSHGPATRPKSANAHSHGVDMP